MHFTREMIRHRLIATAVMLVLMYYLCAVLGWEGIETRIEELGWRSAKRGGRSGVALYLVTMLGWGMVVFSQLLEDWLSDAYYFEASPYVVLGWFLLVTPSVAMLWPSMF